MAIVMRRGGVMRMERHGVETYPRECCGILVGKEQGTRRIVTEVLPVQNARADSPRNRFLILPEDVLRCLHEAERSGVEILGVYHSHPDQPAQPSEFDRQYAWPWLVYLILAVRDGVPQEITAWVMAQDRSKFLPVEMMVSGD